MQNKIKLLIVEDDLNQSFLIAESLDKDQFEISNIQDGLEALDALLSGSINPDLVMLDYHLPNIDGLMIMNKLKEQDKKYNIIFLTADYSIETAIKSINAGALEFIPKDGRFVNNIPAVVDKAYQTISDKAERKKFELALRESEDRFKIVMEASKDGIFEWNNSDGSIHISPNNAHMLQYEVDEYPSTYEGFFELIHPDDKDQLMQKFTEHHLNKTSHYEVEIRMRAKDGSYKWVLERGIIAGLDKNGNPLRVIGTQSDISERKAAEEKLIEANTRLTTLIGNLPGIVYRCKDINFCNKEFLGGRVEEITGFTTDELISEKDGLFINVIYPEDRNCIQEKVNMAFQNHSDFEIYYRIITKSGEIRWIWDHGIPVTSADGNIIAIEGYLADITEMRASEEALKQSEEEKNIILDNSLQAFILIDPEGKIIAFNKAANHRIILTTGMSIKKGIYLFDCVTSTEKELISGYFNKVLNGEPMYWEQSYDMRGEISWFENIMVPILISRGNIKFVCYTSSDITDRKIAEEKIRYSENLYNSTINSLNDLLFVVDKNLNILLVNEALVRFNHQNNYEEKISGKNLLDIYPIFNQQTKEQYFDVFNIGKEFIRENSINFGDRIIFVEIKMTPIFQMNEVARVVTVMRDITERKNFEKRIMNAIIETEERERKRFSEDLHDELGSLLSTIKIYINTLYGEDMPIERRAHLIDFTNQLINQAIENSKEIANNLSPNIIKRFGLISAIQSLSEKIQASSGLIVNFDASAYNHVLKPDEEISVYRIISELVNNTLKHAGAKHINIVFSNSDTKLSIDYSDDGKGFNFEQTIYKSHKGLGLQNITSRINSLGGSYNVENSEPKGFAMHIELLIAASVFQNLTKAQ